MIAAALGLGGCTTSALRWNNGAHQSTRSRPQNPPLRHVVRADEYEVQKGDTLYAIAFRNQLDYHELARWNGIDREYTILPGQVLRLKPPTGQRERPPALVAPAPPAPPVSRPAIPQSSMPQRSAEKPVPSVPPPVVRQAAGSFEWRWPLNGTVARNYAPTAGNKGLDFTGTPGMPVLAAAPGKVVYSGNALKGYGELIIIKHDETYLSAYAYNRRRLVKEGDVVTAGQPIAELGLGPQNQPLLHFEIRKNGQPVNPLDYLPLQDQPRAAR
ncbi:MAG: peptidoglycan DD-metalloendopeptidase family protein [Stenotrophobium sp.]